jgi:hypothetical protein
MASGPASLGRRALIGSVLVGAAGLALPAGAAARKAVKATKAAVMYQDAPMDIRMCGTCSFFTAPKSCTVVAGDVSKKGWCTLFALVD